jgi:hypothetical protein
VDFIDAALACALLHCRAMSESTIDVDAILGDGPVNPYTTSGTIPWRQEDYDRYDAYQAQQSGGNRGQLEDVFSSLDKTGRNDLLDAFNGTSAGGISGTVTSAAESLFGGMFDAPEQREVCETLVPRHSTPR